MVPRLLPLVLGAAVLMIPTGYDSDDPDAAVLYGDAVAVGDGTARTYVTMPGATPMAGGILLSKDTLSGLPAEPDSTGRGMDDVHVLPMPAGSRAAGVVNDHVSVDWNPDGHEPASAYVPAGSIADLSGAVVPTMGLHWLDSTDPTYAPGGPGFTEALLRRSHSGQVVFEETMITKAYVVSLRSSGAVHEEALTQPAAIATAEHYPTIYSVDYDAEARAYRVEGGGLVRRTAS